MLITTEEFVHTGSGRNGMQTYLARPDDEGPHPAVVLYHNVRGLTDDLRWCARRIAQAGYVCAAPDLYYRLGEKIILDTESDDDDALAIKRIAYASALRPFQVANDTEALLDFLSAHRAVTPGPMGAIGHCMGGYFAPLVAGRFPDRIRAAASINPIKLLNDAEDNPRNFMDQMRGEQYFGFAELDKNTPMTLVEEWTRTLKEKCDADWRVEVYAGQRHGFAVPGRPGIWDQAGAEVVFSRALAMFERQLRHDGSPLSEDGPQPGITYSVDSTSART